MSQQAHVAGSVRGKGTMKLPVCDATSHETRPDNNTGTSCPTLSDKCVGSLSFPTNHVTLKLQETGSGKLRFAITVELRYLEL